MAAENLLRIGGVNGDFPFAGMISRTSKWTIQPDLFAAAVNIESHTAPLRRFLKCELRLKIINAGVARFVHISWSAPAGNATLTHRQMANSISLSARDFSLLRLLSWTPATAVLLLRASPSFDGEAFLDERRLRERLQTLSAAGLVRSWPTAHAGGGLQKYYKLTPLGYETICGPEAQKPPRAFFIKISPSLFEHTLKLAEVIVETVRAAHAGRVTIHRLFRENELTFSVGNSKVQPDCFVRFESGGKPFNVAFEIERGTEPLDSHAENSIHTKLLFYDAYQETVLSEWSESGKIWERPRFRLAFLTTSIDRAHYILTTAARMRCNRKRRLTLAATHDSFIAESDPLRSPIFLDHSGHWQSLVDLHPTSSHRKQPVRLKPLVAVTSTIW